MERESLESRISALYQSVLDPEQRHATLEDWDLSSPELCKHLWRANQLRLSLNTRILQHQLHNELAQDKGIALINLDINAQVIDTNSVAKSLLDQGGPLRRRGDNTLEVQGIGEEQLLQLIGQTTRLPDEPKALPCLSLLLAENEDSQPAQGWLLELKPQAAALNPDTQAAIHNIELVQLQLQKMGQGYHAVPKRLIALYQLTPSEADVAVHLACGKSPDQIAQERSSSLSTVRTHVKHIVRKMKVTRVTEVIHLVNVLDS